MLVSWGADDRSAGKSDRLLRGAEDEVAARYAFIDAEKASSDNPGGYPVAFLCRVLHVPRASYYRWRASRAAAAERAEGEEGLVGEIRQIHAESRGAYGAPRVTAKLRRAGWRINRKRVERLMREHDIRGITCRKRRRSLTKQDTKAAPAPDLVGRDFTAAEPGTKLVSDITYLPTLQGWWYLATVIDLATREVIGYAMADHHPASLVVDALKMAAGRGTQRTPTLGPENRCCDDRLNPPSAPHTNTAPRYGT